MHAVALASVLAWLETPEDPAWSEWLKGRFTKTVRRGTAGQFEAAAEFAVATVMVGEVEALGFIPMAYEDMPQPVTKMQVANLDRPKSELWIRHAEGPTVWINEDAGMTTGKTAAQAAHGLFAWLLRQSESDRASWLAEGMPATIMSVPGDAFSAVATEAVVNICDAGFTEVEPGTETVVVTV